MEEQSQPQQAGKKNNTGVIVGGVIIVAILGIIAYYATNHKDAQVKSAETKIVQVSLPPTIATAPSSSSASSPSASAMKVHYKDGIYNAVGDYTSPGGPEEIGVSVTLKDDVITAATVTPKAVRPKSMQMQSAFKSGFKEEVVGKPIDAIALTVVNGSSLSPKGFMDALQKVKEEAKS